MKKTVYISFLFTLLATSFFAQTPTLVQDLYAGNADGFDQWNHKAVKMGNDFFIAANNGTQGLEPYVIKNGSLLLLNDIAAGSESSNPKEFVVFNDKVYFVSVNSEYGASIWSTDGTTAGTSLAIDLPGNDMFVSPKGLTVAKNGALYFSFDGSLYKSAGSTATTAVVPGTPTVDFVEDYASTGLNYTTYGNGVAFLSENGQTLSLWAAEDNIVQLGTITSTSFFYDYFGLSQVAGGLVFAARSSFDTAFTGLYNYDPVNGSLAKISVNGVSDAVITRTMPLNDQRIIVLEAIAGFVSVDGTGTNDQLISSNQPNFLVQNEGLYYTLVGGHLVFLESEPGFDQRILSTDGFSNGTTLIAQPNNTFVSNFINYNEYAVWASGTSNGFTPEIWYAHPASGTAEVYYTFQQNSTNLESVLPIGVQDGKLYYMSNLDSEVGRELYYIPFNLSAVSEPSDASTFTIYNAGREVHIMSTASSEPITVAVYDQTGRLLQQQDLFTNTSFQIEQAVGIFFVQVTGKRQKTVGKVFID
ncbi:MAG: hypothetical protein IPN76_31500 [Saprospiraceae bacterium]|nr:hypothetical protein [Saprospiraceae bacterium]